MNEQALVAKVWNHAHVPRDDVVSFVDYLGQISFLLFPQDGQEADLDQGLRAIPAESLAGRPITVSAKRSISSYCGLICRRRRSTPASS